MAEPGTEAELGAEGVEAVESLALGDPGLDPAALDPAALDPALDPAAANAPADGRGGDWESAPSALRYAYLRARQLEGADDARYHVTRSSGELQAASPGRRVAGRFSADGIEVQSDDDTVHATLRAKTLRCDDTVLTATRSAFATTDAPHRVARTLSAGPLAVDEWVESGPLGLEQGFDVSSREGCDSLVIDVAIDGASATLEGDSVVLEGDEGQLRYAELYAVDAEGTSLPAHFALADGLGDGPGDGIVSLVVDAGEAVFPVTIDPLVYVEDQRVGPESGLGSDGAPNGQFGYAVAVDGDLAIVGTP